MTIRRTALAAAALIGLAPHLLIAQLAPRCTENSPERRGGVGCSVVEIKELPVDLNRPLFWHIDRFDSLGHARSAVGPVSIALDAAGTSWLLTFESDTSQHHGGDHVAHIGPLQLGSAANYTVQVLAAAFTPGMYTAVHHHSGVEAIYVIEGRACLETDARAFSLRKGETLTIAAGTLHRAVALGSSIRYVLGVIVHDAAKPPTMVMEDGAHPPLAQCQ